MALATNLAEATSVELSPKNAHARRALLMQLLALLIKYLNSHSIKSKLQTALSYFLHRLAYLFQLIHFFH